MLGIGLGVSQLAVMAGASMLGPTPIISLDFANEKYQVGNYFYQGPDSRAVLLAHAGSTFTRASVAWYLDSTGTLQQAASHVPRIHKDPVSKRRGFLVESSGTNYATGGKMTGGSAGSPGVFPNGYTNGSYPAGLTRTISFSTEAGFNCTDVRFQGTPSVTANIVCPVIALTDPGTMAPAQVWTASWNVSLVAGVAPSVNLSLFEHNDAGASNANSFTTFIPVLGPIQEQRYQHTRTLSNALTTRGNSQLQVAVFEGNPVDFTIRFAAPQLEQFSIATSHIITDGAPATRAVDALYRINNSAIVSNKGTVFTLATSQGNQSPSLTRHIGVATLDSARAISTIFTTAATRVYGYALTDTVTQFTSPTRQTNGLPAAAALAYGAAGYEFTANGEVTYTAAIGTAPIPAFEAIRVNTGCCLLVERLDWYPETLNAAQLRVLTDMAKWI